jgi:prepilin peptidase CpaA
MIGLPFSEVFIATIWVSLVALAAVFDVAELRIPNRITVAIGALYPAHVVASGTFRDVPAAVGVAMAVFIVGALLFRTGTMGGGDVKLMTAIALWAGPHETLSFLVVTALAGGILALLMTTSARFALAQTFDLFGADIARERVLGTHVPYGVAIAVGAFMAVAPSLLRTAS